MREKLPPAGVDCALRRPPVVAVHFARDPRLRDLTPVSEPVAGLVIAGVRKPDISSHPQCDPKALAQR